MRDLCENSLIRPSRLSSSAAAAVLALVCFTAADAQQALSSKLTAVDHAMMPSAAQIQNWLDQKDSWGPAYTAGPGWKKFMGLLHGELKSMGMVNVGDYPYPYTRWYTSEFPDKSGWSLTSDGKPVDVANTALFLASEGDVQRLVLGVQPPGVPVLRDRPLHRVSQQHDEAGRAREVGGGTRRCQGVEQEVRGGLH